MIVAMKINNRAFLLPGFDRVGSIRRSEVNAPANQRQVIRAGSFQGGPDRVVVIWRMRSAVFLLGHHFHRRGHSTFL